MKFPGKPFLYLTLFCVVPLLFLSGVTAEKYRRHFHASRQGQLERLLQGCASGLEAVAGGKGSTTLPASELQQVGCYLDHLGELNAFTFLLVQEDGQPVHKPPELTPSAVSAIVAALKGAGNGGAWQRRQAAAKEWRASARPVFQGKYYLIGIMQNRVLQGELAQQMFPLLLLAAAGVIGTLGAGCLMLSYFVAQRTILAQFVEQLVAAHVPATDVPRHLFSDIGEQVILLAKKNEECCQRLKLLTITDELTNTLDRDHILAKFAEEQAKMVRYATPLAVILIDIDRFHLINERYGISAGNRMLGRFAAILNNSLRSHDHVGRIGGDEFLLILPLAEARHAAKVAERIRAAVEVTFWGNPEIQLSMSAAIMQLRAEQEGNVNETWLTELYTTVEAAQKRGGNAVVTAGAAGSA